MAKIIVIHCTEALLEIDKITPRDISQSQRIVLLQTVCEVNSMKTEAAGQHLFNYILRRMTDPYL